MSESRIKQITQMALIERKVWNKLIKKVAQIALIPRMPQEEKICEIHKSV